jgi:hypothetical protein
MKGNIYPNKGGYVVRFGRDISKWFKSREKAERFLTGLRYENDKGTFDPRDYASDKPLSFSNLADKWLTKKQKEVTRKSYNNLKNYMTRAKGFYQHTNVKGIDFAELEDFLFFQNVSDKTRSNIKSCLHDFFTWLRKRKTAQRRAPT